MSLTVFAVAMCAMLTANITLLNHKDLQDAERALLTYMKYKVPIRSVVNIRHPSVRYYDLPSRSRQVDKANDMFNRRPSRHW